MKLRIQDNSVRFRITLRELEDLLRDGVLHRETRVPGAQDGAAVFGYEIRVSRNEESRLAVGPFSFVLELSPADLEELAAPDKEGVYIKREWNSGAGTERLERFLVFVEKDRPGSTCTKAEEWVYEYGRGGQGTTTRPIPQTDGAV